MEGQQIFILIRDIASGSFNCAHQIDGPNGPEVIRIAYLPGFTLESNVTGESFHLGGYEQIERQNKRIIRGLEIVHLLNHPAKRFDRILGPSLLKELSMYRIFNEQYEKMHFEGLLCGKLRITQRKHQTLIENKKRTPDLQVDNRFALQHIEFINGGIFDFENIKKAKSWEKEFVAFSLLWFFTMTSQLFGFRHRDLKSDNIMLQRIPNGLRLI
jgi:serine/threonine protein kinase